MFLKIISSQNQQISYSISKEELFPQAREFHTHSSDIFEDNIITKPTNKLLVFFNKIAVFQTGNIQHYLLYLASLRQQKQK